MITAFTVGHDTVVTAFTGTDDKVMINHTHGIPELGIVTGLTLIFALDMACALARFIHAVVAGQTAVNNAIVSKRRRLPGKAGGMTGVAFFRCGNMRYVLTHGEVVVVTKTTCLGDLGMIHTGRDVETQRRMAINTGLAGRNMSDGFARCQGIVMAGLTLGLQATKKLINMTVFTGYALMQTFEWKRRGGVIEIRWDLL